MLRAPEHSARGVLHAAALVDDVLIRDMAPDRLDGPAAPKVEGTWNLHTATLETSGFFVLFSSMAAIPSGRRGNGNLAADNAFLDGLPLPAQARPAGHGGELGWMDRIGLARVAGTRAQPGTDIESRNPQSFRPTRRSRLSRSDPESVHGR